MANVYIKYNNTTIKIHCCPEADGDWITVSPPINGVSRFAGDNPPPTETVFPKDVTVQVCFYSRATVDAHKGFRAELMEGSDGIKQMSRFDNLN